jgi:GDP-mannose 6-dehydrogenase
MKISVFGMGYVGSVTAACLAEQQHEVVGVDTNPTKVDLLNSGQSPVIEPSLGEMIRQAVREGRLRATASAADAVQHSDISLVCVGTPTMRSGRLDLGGVEKVSQELGHALRSKNSFHTIALRSTVLPGTSDTLVTPRLEAASGKKSGQDFAVCYNPEFIREGTAVADFYAPPFTVIGAHDRKLAQPVAQLYAAIEKPLLHTDVRVAELLKYICNAFHALKITFANEVGTLAKAVGVDSQVLMNLFCTDDKLNISRAYLQPGFAFGGSCLPKDVRSLAYLGREKDLKLPVLEAILVSNQLHIQRGIDLVLETGKKRVGILGLSFKPDTDDLRESPTIELVKALIGEGCQVRIFDEKVKLSSIIGANREFVEKEIPHIGALLLDSLEEVVRESEVVVVGRDAREFHDLRQLLRPDQVVIELARSKNFEAGAARRAGICW